METMTTKEAADYLKLHPVTLAKYRGEGRGPKFCKPMKRVLYYKSDLDDWLKEK